MPLFGRPEPACIEPALVSGSKHHPLLVIFQQVLPQGNDGAYLRERTQQRMRKRKNANVDMHNTGTNGRGETKQAGAADLLIIEG